MSNTFSERRVLFQILFISLIACALVGCWKKENGMDSLIKSEETAGRFQFIALPVSKEIEDPQILVMDTKTGLLWQYEVNFNQERLIQNALKLNLDITKLSLGNPNRMELKGFADPRTDILGMLTKLPLSEFDVKWIPIDSLEAIRMDSLHWSRLKKLPEIMR